MSTYPTSASVGGEKAAISKNPRKATPWGRRMERSEVWKSGLEVSSQSRFKPRAGLSVARRTVRTLKPDGERRDRTLTLSVASSSRPNCVCASAQPWPKPTSHRPNVATLGNTQSRACALCWRKTLCAGGTLAKYRPPTLVDMSASAMSRTSPSQGRSIYPAVGTFLKPQSSTITTLLSSIPGQQQHLQRVSSPLTAYSAEYLALH